jgi:hypothetical protein
LTELEGSVISGGDTIPINTGFFDFTDNLGGNIHFEVWNSQWALILDLQYTRWLKDIEESGEVTKASGNVSVVEISASHSFGDDYMSPELLIGGRFNKLDSKIVYPDGQETENDRNWFHPLIGIRFGYSLSDRLSLWARGDAGGFVFRSDLTWNASLLAEYQLMGILSLLGGYRILDIDYTDGSEEDLYQYNMQFRGALLSVVLRF